MKRILMFLFAMCIACTANIGGGEDVKAQTAQKEAIFAGGCFWCMEADFEKVAGVKEVISGYAGGTGENPTYEDYGSKGHIEVVKIVYDPETLTYAKLLELFWHKVDPTDAGGQFCDRGYGYTAAIFYRTDEEKRLAEDSKSAIERSGQLKKPVATKILQADAFYKAEEYHQDYYKKSPLRYKFYRFNCGRDRRLKEVWGDTMEFKKMGGAQSEYEKSSPEELRKKLTQMQYEVTQNDGTEPPFKNEYWDNKKLGIYVDIVSGEPLFSSTDKFKSGTGWPSFTRPLEPANIAEHSDRKFFAERTEVRSRQADSHLGHVFKDGPQPTGLRYCINSAALRFVPADKLVDEGYEKYQELFK